MEKLTFSEKTKSFFKSKTEEFLTAFIILVLFNLMLVVNGCFPYGKNTLAMGDTLAQIGAFLGHVFDAIKGEANLFYTNNLAGGVEVFSTIQYMLLNPFYIFAFLGGKNNIYLMLNFSVMFMFVFNAVTFVWFAKKHFQNLKPVIRIIFSILFAFSPYVAANFCFITWLIYPALVLILIDKFLNLVNKGKILGFVVMTVWYVCNCFSVGVSTTIILLVLFSAYIFFTKTKEERKSLFVRLVVAYVISVLAAIVILFPSLMAFMGTSRTESMFSHMFDGDYKHQTLARIAFLTLPLVCLICSVYYLIKCNKKEGKNKFYLFGFVLSFLIVAFGMISELLSGGTIYGLYFRFGHIFIVLIFVLTLEFFNADHAVKPKEESRVLIYSILQWVLSFIGLFVFVWWVAMCFNKFDLTFKSSNVNVGFALMTLILNVSLIVLFFFGFIIRYKGLVLKKTFSIFSMFMLILSVMTNYLVVGVGANDYIDYGVLEEKTITLDSNSRLKFLSSNLEQKRVNSTGLGVKNMSYFSSLISDEMVYSFGTLGYQTSKVNVCTTYSNVVADSLFGVRYMVSYNKLQRPNLKLLYAFEDYYIYENTLATTGAVVLDTDFSFDDELSTDENFEKLRECFGIEGTICSSIEIDGEFVENEQGHTHFMKKYKHTATKNEYIYIDKSIITLDAGKKNDLFNEYTEKITKDIPYFYVDDRGYKNVKSEILYVEAGETVEFYLCGMHGCTSADDIKFYSIDYDVAEKVCQKLQECDVQLEYTKNGYQVNLDGKSGKLVIFNVDIDGMNYKINGKKTETNHEFGYFTSFDVNQNTKVIKATYVYPHTISWVVVGLIAVSLIVLVVILYKKTGFKFLEKIIHPAFIVVNCCILLVFVGFGLVLTIFRIIL